MPTNDTSNNQLKITNSTKVDFAVIDSVSKHPDDDPSLALVPVLKLLKTTTGANSIALGTSAAVTLSDTYTDPKTGKVEPSLLYRLIFSTTDWLVPVNIKGVIQDLITEQYKPITVAEADRQAMQAALQFQIMITVYPTSDLAKNFNAAVSASFSTADQAQSGDDVTKSVNAFFKGTKEYSHVTFDMVMAIGSYLDTFPFAWARYQNAMTYYLYSSDGKNPTKYEGQLTMQRSASGIPDVTDSNGGYKIVFTDADNKTTNLTYTNQGQLLDDVNVDIPNIALRGTFTLKSRLTGKASDNQIISILTGSIAGTTVLGIDEKQGDNSSNDKRTFWQTLFEPQGAQEIFNSILQISGVLFTLHFVATGLWGLGKWVRQKLTGTKPANFEELIKAQTKSFEAAIQKSNEELYKKLTVDRQKPPADLEAAEAELQSNLETQSAWGQKAALEDGIEAEATRLESLAEAMPDGPTPELEEAAGNLRDLRDTLNSATPENITEVVKGQADQLDTVRQTITTEQANVEKQLSEDVQQELAQQKEVSDIVKEDLEKISEDGQSIEDGEIPEGEEAPEIPEIPEFAI